MQRTLHPHDYAGLHIRYDPESCEFHISDAEGSLGFTSPDNLQRFLQAEATSPGITRETFGKPASQHQRNLRAWYAAIRAGMDRYAAWFTHVNPPKYRIPPPSPGDSTAQKLNPSPKLSLADLRAKLNLKG